MELSKHVKSANAIISNKKDMGKRSPMQKKPS
jgi:hypothetical protein